MPWHVRIQSSFHGDSFLLLAFLLIVTSCSFQQPTSTPTSSHPAITSAPQVSLSPAPQQFGPVPVHCPASPAISTKVFPNGWGGYLIDQKAIGTSPVWATDILADDLFHVDQSGYEAWPGTKIIWEVGPSFSQTITVRVTSLATGELSWWDTGEGSPPPVHVSQILTLDTTQPTYHGSPEPGWREWGSYLYFSQAGCFAMDATWPGGHWRIFFGVGH